MQRVNLLSKVFLSFFTCIALTSLPDTVTAQSSIWDSTISNSNWYVPMPQLLAYLSTRAGFNNPVPIGDQTL